MLRIEVFQIKVFQIEVNERGAQGKNQKDVGIGVVGQRQAECSNKWVPPEQDRHSTEKGDSQNLSSCRGVHDFGSGFNLTLGDKLAASPKRCRMQVDNK